MGLVKSNPIAALLVLIGIVVVVLLLAGPIISFVKFVLMLIGGGTVVKWVVEALGDDGP